MKDEMDEKIVFLSGEIVPDDAGAPVGTLVNGEAQKEQPAPKQEEVREEQPAPEKAAAKKEQAPAVKAKAETEKAAPAAAANAQKAPEQPKPAKAPQSKPDPTHTQWTETIDEENAAKDATSTQEVLSTSYYTEGFVIKTVKKNGEPKKPAKKQTSSSKPQLDPWSNASVKSKKKPAEQAEKKQQNNNDKEEQTMATDDKKTKKTADTKTTVAKAEPAKKPAPKAEPAKKPAAKAEPAKPAKTEPAKAEPKAEKKPAAKAEPAPEKVIIEGDPNNPHGKFVIKKTDNGNFVYKLYSSNFRVLASPGGAYKDLSSCKSGIQSVIANAATAPVEDTTLKKYEEQKCPKWVIYIDKAGEFRLRLIASNGNVVAITNDGYTTKDAARKGIDAIARAAKGASVVRNDTLW